MHYLLNIKCFHESFRGSGFLWKLLWKPLSFRESGSFIGSKKYTTVEVASTEAFPVEASVEGSVKAFVEASVKVVSTFVEAFVEATSMEAPVEAFGFFFSRGSFHSFRGSFHSFRGSFHSFHGRYRESFHRFRESFHGSFHKLPREKQVVQETTSKV